MNFLVSKTLAQNGANLQSVEPWLDAKKPVWEGVAPFGIFLNSADKTRFQNSDFAALMKVLRVPVSQDETLIDFCAAAMAARIDQLVGEAAVERAAAAALRKDFMQLQENFCAVEGFLNGALAPRFTLAGSWEFADKSISLQKGSRHEQLLNLRSSALVAVDIWMISGQARLTLLGADGVKYTAPQDLSGKGWQRIQFDAIGGLPGSVSLVVDALDNCEIGLSHTSPLEEFADRPLALRVWKGLLGVKLPKVVQFAHDEEGSFVLPADLPKPVKLGSGHAKYLEAENIIMFHSDYYGAAQMALRGVSLGSKCSAHVQNCGPETVEILIVQVAENGSEPVKYHPKVFLAPEAYMQIQIAEDVADASDLIVEFKGQSSLDCISLRGIEVG